MLNSSCGYIAVREKLGPSLVLRLSQRRALQGSSTGTSESGGSSSPHRQWGVQPALGKLSKSLCWSDPAQLSERAGAGWENE